MGTLMSTPPREQLKMSGVSCKFSYPIGGSHSIVSARWQFGPNREISTFFSLLQPSFDTLRL